MNEGYGRWQLSWFYASYYNDHPRHQDAMQDLYCVARFVSFSACKIGINKPNTAQSFENNWTHLYSGHIVHWRQVSLLLMRESLFIY